MSNIVKSFLAGAVMSLSRLNQVKQRDNFIDDDENEFAQEQQVRKQEIKIISESRFYELLNAAENASKLRHSERTAQILKSRGIDGDFLSFKNITYGPPLHEQLSGNMNFTYKFKTDNDICKYSSDVHIKEQDGVLTLSFLINLLEHPIVRKIASNLSNLTALAINDNARIYAYEVKSFRGIIRPNDNEIYVVFDAECKMNGEYVRELSNESRMMHKNDLIDPRTYKL
jgi:hypothetical protein